jgi:hypothetical protein
VLAVGLLIALAGWLAAAVAIGLSVARFTPARTAAAMDSIASWGVGYGYLVALPDLEPYRTTRPFLARVREVTADRPTGVALYRTRDAVWYPDPGAAVPECGSWRCGW